MESAVEQLLRSVNIKATGLNTENFLEEGGSRFLSNVGPSIDSHTATTTKAVQ